MKSRSNSINRDALENLYTNHPYLLIFKKDDWIDYLILLRSIYDLLEDERAKVPYEILRSMAIRHFSQSALSFVEQKVLQFFTMMIGEIEALRDSHDQFGQRYIESTRFGKELLLFVDRLLSQRVRYSGTGAETLLGALNNIVLGAEQMTDEQAIEHHKDKIRAYQKDIQNIKARGVSSAELLPIPHSNEALFSQAEDAAIHILSSIEDVKSAIEKQRQVLAESYFQMKTSAGKSINSITDFYERLYQTNEYSSYNQAKNLLSYLESFTQRFPQKNIDRLLHEIQAKSLLTENQIDQSHVKGFMSFFRSADESIQDKIRTQLAILQQQVSYSMSMDVKGLQKSLEEIFVDLVGNKERALGYFDDDPVFLDGLLEFDFGLLDLFHFEYAPEVSSEAFELNEMSEDEKRLLFESLLQAEETTIQQILDNIQSVIKERSRVYLNQFPFRYGLAQFYVLSEIALFDNNIKAESVGSSDVVVPTKYGDIVLRNTIDKVYSFSEEVNLK